MARAYAWQTGNDMVLQLSGLASSTNASVAINNSTGVTASVWSPTTSGTEILSGVLLSYVAGTNGTYRYTAQSTGTQPAYGTRGVAIIRVAHSGLNGEYRVPFRVERRGTT